MKPSVKNILAVILPPFIFFILMMIAWDRIVVALEIKAFLVPRPWNVIVEAVEEFSKLATAIWFTTQAAVAGFILSLILGTLISFAFALASSIRYACYPYALFLQTVPIVAIAPLIILWTGYGMKAVIIISMIISLFPVITNGTTGLISVDSNLLDLFRLNKASRWQILWKLQFPHSIPHFITGAKISCGLSVVGAIVGEFFAGSGNDARGLGHLIRLTSETLKTELLFASIFSSTLLGVGIFALVSLLGTTVLKRWHYR